MSAPNPPIRPAKPIVVVQDDSWEHEGPSHSARQRARLRRLAAYTLAGLASAGAVVVVAPRLMPSQGSSPKPGEDMLGRQRGAPNWLPNARRTAPPASAEGSAALPAALAQARFWRAQGRWDLTLQAAQRALEIDAGNVEALVAATDAAGAQNLPEAAGFLAELRRVAPGDPRLREVETNLGMGTDDFAVLAEARSLAGQGQHQAALQRYQTLFQGGEPAPSLLAEYIQVLAASSENGYRQALERMARAVQRMPGDAGLSLTYAQLLTYREDRRIEGIDRLRELAATEPQGGPARISWRQAVLWLGPSPEATSEAELYLRSNPADPELEQLVEQSKTSVISEATTQRLLAWNALGENKFADAERGFLAAIAAEPTDGEAVLGLAIIRKRQQRIPEMQRLLQQALALAPDRRDEFIRALAPDQGITSPNTPVAGVSNAALAWEALNRGDLDKTDRFARRAAQSRGEERLQGEVVLGLLAVRRDDFTTAEARFRAALAISPQLPVALAGLHDALQRQGRFAEAEAVERQPGYVAPDNPSGRAYALRGQALREASLTRREALLRQALQADPENAWVRLDIVRLLRSTGRLPEAQALTATLARETGPEASLATALLAMEGERPADAVQALERVPQRLRTTDMTRLLASAKQKQDIDSLRLRIRQGDPAARARLLALAATPDATGDTAAAVIGALGQLGDGPGAAKAARDALAANNGASASMRLPMAVALLSAGQPAEADYILEPLQQDTSLKIEERRQLETLRGNLALAQSNRLMRAGDAVAAERALQPALADAPDGAAANMAMVRLHLAARRYDQARSTAEALLMRDPANLEARMALVDLARLQGDLAQAERLLAAGRTLHPGDAQLAMQEARLAQDAGDAPRAQRLLEAALRHRLAALRAQGGNAEAQLAADLQNPQRAASRAGAELRDTTTAELVQALNQARQRTATWLQAGVGLRTHSGTRGLGRLTEVTSPVEISTPVPGIGGRAYVQAGSVSLSNGGFGANSVTAAQFGSNPLAGGTTTRRANNWVTGASLGLGYARDNLRVDIGATPLGMPITNVLGGAELAIPMGGGLSLNLRAERRAVTESMLSYAGERDTRTGRSWGGVTRTGVRAQLSYAPSERFGFYGSGAWAVERGTHVAPNAMVQFGGGAYLKAWQSEGQEVTVGPDVGYTHHDRNLGNFTYGQGGYFSPQAMVSTSMQASWRAQWGDLSTNLQASVGWQRFNTHSSAIFPNDPAMQAQLQASATPGTATRYAAQSQSGVMGGVAGTMEYALDSALRLGVSGRYSRAGNYNEAAGLMYLRWRLDKTAKDLPPALAGMPTRHPAPSWPLASTLQNGAPEPVRLQPGAERPTW